jgi:hypothetical protein
MDHNSLDTPSNSSKRNFFNHVFSSNEEGKAEILNVIQYSLMGVVPIVILNKLVQRFIPDAENEKSSIEILAEIVFQLVVMFIGVVLIHRMITYVPTYSDFKYESLSLTNVILIFMVLLLSIQTKIGIKVNILFDRIMDLWTGSNTSSKSDKKKSKHVSSRGDYHTESSNENIMNAPMSTQHTQSFDIRNNLNAAPQMEMQMSQDPMPANSLGIGSIF